MRSSTTRSVGASPSGKSISGFVRSGSSAMLRVPFGQWWSGSVRVEDVDDEDEGVGAGDLGRAALRAVAVLRRDRQQHATPDLLAHQGGVPTRNDATHADREV